MPAKKPTKYVAQTGLTYPASLEDVELAAEGLEYQTRTVEAGEVLDDLPQRSIGWLLEQEIILTEDEHTKRQERI